jgi:hypothetical protein
MCSKTGWNEFKRKVRQNGMDSNVNMLTSDGQNGFECLSRTGYG